MATQTITMNINGEAKTAEVEDRLLLVHLIRDNIGLTGTHIGCDTTHCGACTVLIDGLPVDSCLVLGVEVEGAEIITIEGIAAIGQLNPVQDCFLEEAALQCGICTPGFIVTARALLDKKPDADEQTIRFDLSGNLCRCTGYDKIVRAIQAVQESS